MLLLWLQRSATLPYVHVCFPVWVLIGSQPHQPRDINAKPYQTGKKDKVFTSEDESDGVETETKIAPSSCQIRPPVVQETAL